MEMKGVSEKAINDISMNVFVNLNTQIIKVPKKDLPMEVILLKDMLHSQKDSLNIVVKSTIAETVNYLYQHKDEHEDIIDFIGSKDKSKSRRDVRKQHRKGLYTCSYCGEPIVTNQFHIDVEEGMFCKTMCYRNWKKEKGESNG